MKSLELSIPITKTLYSIQSFSNDVLKKNCSLQKKKYLFKYLKLIYHTPSAHDCFLHFMKKHRLYGYPMINVTHGYKTTIKLTTFLSVLNKILTKIPVYKQDKFNKKKLINVSCIGFLIHFYNFSEEIISIQQ